MRFTRSPARWVAVQPQHDWLERRERIWTEVERQFSCECGQRELRYLIYRNGVKHFVRQCLRCGDYSSSLPRKTLLSWSMAKAPPVDQGLKERWRERRNELRDRLYHEARADDSNSFWTRYNEYLQSEAWLAKRAAVLRRDRHTCQYCGQPASQVHHLTYDHVFDERLFELVSVCKPCHEAHHG